MLSTKSRSQQLLGIIYNNAKFMSILATFQFFAGVGDANNPSDKELVREKVLISNDAAAAARVGLTEASPRESSSDEANPVVVPCSAAAEADVTEASEVDTELVGALVDEVSETVEVDTADDDVVAAAAAAAAEACVVGKDPFAQRHEQSQAPFD